MREQQGSAIWGGATIGLVVGLILGFFVGTYWTTVLYAVAIGAAVGLAANILAWTGNTLDRLGNRGRKRAALTNPSETSRAILDVSEKVLRKYSPADFETTPNAAAECVYVTRDVEDDEEWRAGYGSLDSFYAAHEARHPDIRVYATVGREPPIAELIDAYQDDSDPEWPEGLGKTIATLIAIFRAEPH